VQILEKSLSQVVREFEQERDEIMRKSRTDNEANVVEVEKLRRTLELRNKEMNKVKKLAKIVGLCAQTSSHQSKRVQKRS